MVQPFTSSGDSGGAWTGGVQVATVDASTGVITPQSAGVSTITYTVSAAPCSDALATRDVTVTTAPDAGTLSGTQGICSNGSTTFTTSGDSGGTWTSGSTGVATVDASTGAITPQNAGTSTITYTVSGSGGCSDATATRDVTINPDNTAGSPSSSPTVCVGDNITSITIATTGATGIGTSSGFPTGISASFNSNTITITGPVIGGPNTYNYTIPLTGGCGSVDGTGTIIVAADNTVGAASSTPTLCINTALTNITHATTGATGISNDGVIEVMDYQLE